MQNHEVDKRDTSRMATSLPLPMGLLNLKFDECSLGNERQQGIGGFLRDNFVVVRAFLQLVGKVCHRLIEVEILAHLAGLLQ